MLSREALWFVLLRVRVDREKYLMNMFDRTHVALASGKLSAAKSNKNNINRDKISKLGKYEMISFQISKCRIFLKEARD